MYSKTTYNCVFKPFKLMMNALRFLLDDYNILFTPVLGSTDFLISMICISWFYLTLLLLHVPFWDWARRSWTLLVICSLGDDFISGALSMSFWSPSLSWCHWCSGNLVNATWAATATRCEVAETPGLGLVAVTDGSKEAISTLGGGGAEWVSTCTLLTLAWGESGHDCLGSATAHRFCSPCFQPCTWSCNGGNGEALQTLWAARAWRGRGAPDWGFPHWISAEILLPHTLAAESSLSLAVCPFVCLYSLPDPSGRSVQCPHRMKTTHRKPTALLCPGPENT